MAKAADNQEQAQEKQVKLNKDGFVPGQLVSPKELSEFKQKQRKK